MNNQFVCPICGNKNPNSIGYLNGKPYCRACISFIRREKIDKQSAPKQANIFLDYSLSEEQEELSNKLVLNYKRGIDSLVHAVCGSGKTEISLAPIKYAINCGEKVAFAVPRKDVVIELHNRLKSIFKFNKVIAVYGGHHEIVNGDIIVLTTHQLFRYERFFSLIVLDEIDAFPFKGNEILKNMFFNSLTENGHYIMMSATPTQDVIDLFSKGNKEILRLDIRFHRHPLPVPTLIIKKTYYKYLILVKTLGKHLKNNHPVFVFAPTIDQCESLFVFLNMFFLHGNCVHSQKQNRNEIINDFREGKYKYLVTTSVLERGVTVKDLQVIVFNADHNVYDKGTLIQIAGRSGRKKDAPDGEVCFIATNKTKEMEEACENIRKSNQSLQNLLQGN